jgi:hypothetical protein
MEPKKVVRFEEESKQEVRIPKDLDVSGIFSTSLDISNLTYNSSNHDECMDNIKKYKEYLKE